MSVLTGHRHRTRPDLVAEDAMTAALGLETPAVRLQNSDHVTDFQARETLSTRASTSDSMPAAARSARDSRSAASNCGT